MSQILSAGQQLLWFLIVVGTLVFLHEAGHFLAAKSFRIRVEVFSLGFGRRLFGFKRGDTDYRVSLVPIGGYVSMMGGEVSGETEAPLGPDHFLSRPRWQRFVVMMAGVTVNLAVALALFTAIFVIGHPMPMKIPAVVKAVREGSPAAEAGVLAGDRVTAVGGVNVTGQIDAEQRLQKAGLAETGIAWRGRPAVVGKLIPGYPAEKAGVREGDRVVAIDGKPIADADEMVETIHAAPGRELTLSLKRSEQLVELKVTPVKETHFGREVGITGFGVAPPAELVKLPLLPAGRYAFAFAREQTGTLFGVLRHVFIRDGKVVEVEVERGERMLAVSLKPNVGFTSFSGPLDIAQASAAAARTLTGLLFWMGFISLQLGILNLLPIPVLDGGHIFILLTESVIRRDLSLKVKEVLLQVGFVALMALMVFVLGHDIIKRI